LGQSSTGIWFWLSGPGMGIIVGVHLANELGDAVGSLIHYPQYLEKLFAPDDVKYLFFVGYAVTPYQEVVVSFFSHVAHDLVPIK